MVIVLFHLVAVFHFCYGNYFGATVVAPGDIAVRKFEFGGALIYLTNINFMMQTFYFVLALINDFTGTNDVIRRSEANYVRKLRDFFFAVYSFPTAVEVTTFFWMLYSIDRELVFPKALDEHLPVWFNHMIHSNVTIFMVIEMMLTHHNYPSTKKMFKYLGTFIGSYITWTVIIKYKTNHWVYPILEELELPYRIAFFAFVAAVGFGMYFLGRGLNNYVWSDRLKSAEKERKTR